MCGPSVGVEAPLAHSGRAERGVPPQPYWEHASAVADGAKERAERASSYWSGAKERFVVEVHSAGLYHDCGKLCVENQNVLRRGDRQRLKVDHTDGGAALLLESGHRVAAMLVQSHHAPGLPSVPDETAGVLRRPPCPAFRKRDVLQHTSANLDRYREAYRPEHGLEEPTHIEDWTGLTHRIALSCLVDADHTDTARHCGEMSKQEPIAGRWGERLARLDQYVRGLREKAKDQERADQRMKLYEGCRNADVEPRLRSCEAAVGTGKTTAVMAFLLRAAMAGRLRHVFVVLPYTNIIRQSVEVYRDALVLDDEDPEEVVSELHHLADFEKEESRHLAALWRAPVVVTTAVQFFETLAGNLPARVRKLHELPGSAVFIDEAHAAIPTGLWPQTWLWLKEVSQNWGCHFVLGSGSLTRFREIPELAGTAEEVPDIAPREVREELNVRETVRIAARRNDAPMSLKEAVRFVTGLKGPRLVILNTVQNAAILADEMRAGGSSVLHLSTALTPADRARVVDRVRERLKYGQIDDWSLVATSCVEAGVDFSFRSGVRESCSAASLIQTGGRVNREGSLEQCEVWDVRLQDALFNSNEEFQRSRTVLERLFEDGAIDRMTPASLVTEAMRQELLAWRGSQGDEIKQAEKAFDFVEVAKKYRVIGGDTRLVVVDPGLRRRLWDQQRVRTRELLLGSVQIWMHRIDELKLRELPMLPDVYEWTASYDPEFLGYMAGVLPLIQGRMTGILLG